MLKAIFYKEIIKTQRIVSMSLLLSIVLVIYIFLNNSYLLRIDGAIGVWSAVADQGAWIVPGLVRWFLVLVPIAISAVQYASEIVNKRLKLTLHLPHSETKIVVAMQFFGLVATALIYSILLLPTWTGMLLYYPIEMVNAMMFTLLPYILAGVVSYFFVAWVIVEPIWIRRVAYVAISIGALSIFTMEANSLCRYRYAVVQLIVIVVASWISALYSASRFKDGAQQ